MRERKFIKKCPDGCGKDEYDLGIYRGFKLTQKPFYNGWAIYAELVLGPDDLDRLMMGNNTFPNEFFDDTERIDNPSLEIIEQGIITSIDSHWADKQRIINNCNEGKYQVSI
jgi:hypothetical protein